MTEAAKQVARMAADHATAWNAHDGPATALLFAEDGEISVNGGPAHSGRADIAENAVALMATFPDLTVTCHLTRHAGNRAVFLWTLEGRHAETGNFVSLPGWHEWELDADMLVRRCRGFYDAESLERQIAGSRPDNAAR